MNWRKFILFACVGGLCITLSSWANVSGSKLTKPQQPPTQLSVKQLHSKAQAFVEDVAEGIAVKVMSQDFLGSGILLQKQGTLYTVLTNAHVLRAGNSPYRIQTADGRIWVADVPKTNSFGKNDLALLQFRSTGTVYSVASFGSSPAVGEQVFAAGFPLEEEEIKEKGFTLTAGKVSLVLPKALEGGYQIGYTNDIPKGMSGGPLLNRRGEVVGVNGMHAYPLWDAPSVFADGSEADATLHQKIVRLSWAVPIQKVRNPTPNPSPLRVSPSETLLFETLRERERQSPQTPPPPHGAGLTASGEGGINPTPSPPLVKGRGECTEPHPYPSPC